MGRGLLCRTARREESGKLRSLQSNRLLERDLDKVRQTHSLEPVTHLVHRLWGRQ